MIVQTEMHQLNFKEDTRHLVDMDTGILTNLGSVDTSIIELAKLHTKLHIESHKSFIVLTSDSGVFNRCMKEQVSVEWAKDRIEKFIYKSL
ncbi:MAG: hypothetical protein HRF42_12280 [Candidatus Brocadia sp.]|jgi:hypothetical protein